MNLGKETFTIIFVAVCTLFICLEICGNVFDIIF